MMATNHGSHKVYHDVHSNQNVKTNGILLRNRQIDKEFTVIPSSENRFVAVMVVAIIVEPRYSKHGFACICIPVVAVYINRSIVRVRVTTHQ